MVNVDPLEIGSAQDTSQDNSIARGSHQGTQSGGEAQPNTTGRQHGARIHTLVCLECPSNVEPGLLFVLGADDLDVKMGDAGPLVDV